MIETNIKMVSEGLNMRIATRVAKVSGSQERADLLELACSRLKTRRHIAAVRHPDAENCLLVATNANVPPISFQEENWQITVEDANEPLNLGFSDPLGGTVIPELIERMLLASLLKLTDRWTIGGRPRHFYEQAPYKLLDGIAAYRRVAVSAVLIEDVGVGVACDFQSSFFTSETLQWFFSTEIGQQEAAGRRKIFDRLAQRQQGQGTLLHKHSGNHSICYFGGAPDGVTCESTGPIWVKRRGFDSLFAYYESLGVRDVLPEDRAIKVSFPSGSGSVWVAAKFVRLSVFNDALPRQLETTIHLKPHERRRATLEFWSDLGPDMLGRNGPKFSDDLWTPPVSNVWVIPPPALLFGAGTELRPANGIESYKDYWHQRTPTLHKAGCFFSPAIFPRVIHCAHPADLPSETVRVLLNDLCAWLKKWTGKQIASQVFPYQRVRDGIEEVQGQSTPGLLLFLMNNEANAYSEISTELHERRPKHMNARTLVEHFEQLKNGAWNSRQHSKDLRRGRLKWDAFTGLLAIDLLQLHDGVPWAVERGPFEAILVIDVGHDRRHYGLSLLVVRGRNRLPEFRIETEVKPKADVKHEAINKEILKERIVRLFQKALSRAVEPLDSGLILRDGGCCGDEGEAIDEAWQKLKNAKVIASNARLCTADFSKDSATQIRMWEVRDTLVENVAEGTALELDDGQIILANTGRTTLHQGTAEPIALKRTKDSGNFRDAAKACFFGAQLNWSQPRVAARLLLPLSRTDEELIKCAQEEVRHHR